MNTITFPFVLTSEAGKTYTLPLTAKDFAAITKANRDAAITKANRDYKKDIEQIEAIEVKLACGTSVHVFQDSCYAILELDNKRYSYFF